MHVLRIRCPIPDVADEGSLSRLLMPFLVTCLKTSLRSFRLIVVGLRPQAWNERDVSPISPISPICPGHAHLLPASPPFPSLPRLPPSPQPSFSSFLHSQPPNPTFCCPSVFAVAIDVSADIDVDFDAAFTSSTCPSPRSGSMQSRTRRLRTFVSVVGDRPEEGGLC